ncbi:MAG: ParA family protein [Muribaculum sp.]|nr:ParA family protein [Muribaculum sp.]
MKEPKFVAFSTQKGGAGKTTLTVTMASYLYYCKGIKVMVVDCDYPQYSIDYMRQREKQLMELSPTFKKSVSDTLVRSKLRPFPVLVCPPEQAMQKVRDIVEDSEDIDVIFFDLPGTVNNHGVVNVVSCMDIVIIPIAADNVVLESSLAFALKLNELLTTGKSQIKELYMLWNMVDAREKTDLYDRYEKLFEELGLVTLHTRIPDTKKYRREGSQTLERAVFRSTVMPPDRTLLKGTRLTELAEEVLKIIKD